MLARTKAPGLHAIARMWEMQPKQLYQFMLVTEKVIKEKPAALQAFVKANIEATCSIYSDKARVIPIMVKYTNYPRKIVEDTYDFLVKSCI